MNTLDGNPTFVEDGPAVVLDTDVDVSDAELDALHGGLGNYAGASLTLRRNGGASTEDVFVFNNGNGITLSSGSLVKNGQVIATFDTSSTPGELVITFTDANGEIPLSTDVDNILRQIAYSNSSDAPPTSARIDWTFNDGNSGSQGTGGALAANGNTTVNITAVNEAPTFAIGTGSAVTDIGTSTDGAMDLIEQPDGKYLVAGYGAVGGSFDFTLVRYNEDGTLDTSFGSGGVVTTSFTAGNDVGQGVALQSDGKIIVAGYNSNYDFAVARYNVDGTLDTSFGTGGTVTTSVGGTYDFGYKVVVQGDGKIVVAGTSRIGSFYDRSLVRYNTDGSLDTGFGTGGMVITAISPDNDGATDVVLQTDGKILVAGQSNNGSDTDFAVTRYNTDGSLDTSFGTGGIVTTPIGAGDDAAESIVLQSDGKIVVGGWTVGSDNDFAVVRDNSDGSLDTSFGTGGKVTAAIGVGDDRAYDVSLQADGKILVTGRSDMGTSYDFSLLRYNADGSLDTTFGTGGVVTTDVGSNADYGYSVLQKSDGTILVAGHTSNGITSDFGLVRYNADGSLYGNFNPVNTLDGTPTFVQGGAPVVLDADVEVFDQELSAANDFSGASLTLQRNGGANAEDLFSATGNLSALSEGGNLVLSGITVGTVTTNSAGTLVLTFNSNATQARVNEVMQSLAYANGSASPPSSAQIDWVFSDGNAGAQGPGGALTANGNTVVSITTTNAPPSPTTTPATLGYVENDGQVAVDPGLTITDPDSPTLSSATVRIIAGFTPSEDLLAFTNQLGISGSYDAGTGILSLTGIASLTDYQTALRTVTYENTSENPNTANRSISFMVNDGTSSGSATRLVSVTAVNDSPTIAANSGLTVDEGVVGTVITSLMLNEGDVDDAGVGLTYTITSAPINGTLRVSGTALGVSDTFTQADIDAGIVTYDHDGSETTTDSFDFSLADGGEDGATPAPGTFNFTVNPVNDSPIVATNAGMTAAEGSTGNVLTTAMLNEGDPDDAGAGLIYTITGATGNGTLRLLGTALNVSDTFTQADIDAGNVTYDHDGSETTTDSFDFSLADGGEDGSTPATGTFNFTITGSNDEQVLATNTGATVSEGAAGNVITTLMLETTDTDNTPAQLVYTVTSATGNGTLRLSGAALNVSDTFTQADINAGIVTYDHDGSETIGDSFAFDVDDGQGAVSSGTFNLAVNPVNDSPIVATNAGMTAAEGSTGNVLTTAMLNEGDPDDAGAGLTYTITGATGNGTLRLLGTALNVSDTFTQADIDAGNVTYDHDGSETTTDSFDFSLADGGEDGSTPATGTFNFTITGSNDEQVLATNTGATVSEGAAGNVITTLMLETTDTDNTPAQLVYTVTNATGNGTLRLSGTALNVSDTFTQADINAGIVTYDHDGSETIGDSFAFDVDDGQGAVSSGTFNLTVQPG